MDGMINFKKWCPNWLGIKKNRNLFYYSLLLRGLQPGVILMATYCLRWGYVGTETPNNHKSRSLAHLAMGIWTGITPEEEELRNLTLSSGNKALNSDKKVTGGSSSVTNGEVHQFRNYQVKELPLCQVTPAASRTKNSGVHTPFDFLPHRV